MRVLAIDPGPKTSGVVLYDSGGRRVVWTSGASDLLGVRALIRGGVCVLTPDVIVCERVQSYGIAGGSLLRTAEVYGRIAEIAFVGDFAFCGMYRREVLQALDVTGKGSRDARVRARCIEMHGGTRAEACGRKAAPGPLYGVSSHAWQALGLALAWLALGER